MPLLVNLLLRIWFRPLLASQYNPLLTKDLCRPQRQVEMSKTLLLIHCAIRLTALRSWVLAQDLAPVVQRLAAEPTSGKP